MSTDSYSLPIQINVPLVERLISGQFPQYSHLEIKPVENSGWDNRTFHLGETMSIRLPSAKGYAAAVEKEQHWLPRIAPLVPLSIPTPIGMGYASDEYPWPWSIYKWLQGDIATPDRIANLNLFAADLAEFLNKFHQLNLVGGPTPGARSGSRGGPVSTCDEAVRSAIEDLQNEVDPHLATDIWESALSSSWSGSPVWVHGDVAAGNLLVCDGRLSAVIDFGQLVVGDPACDLVIAWTLLTPDSREKFRTVLEVDDDTWSRGRGSALWKALIVRAKHIETNIIETQSAQRVIDQLLTDHKSTIS